MTQNPKKKWSRRFWLIPPLIIAVAAWIMLPKLTSPPQRTDAAERAVKVRVIQAPGMTFVPRAIGYGSSQPAQTWEAVAEVAGQVVWLAEELKSGKIVAAGTELLRIDDATYRLALTQAQTQLSALEVRERITHASLDLEERGQALLVKETERKRSLNKRGLLAETTLEEAERTLLKGETAVQNLRNTLALNAAEREVLKTQLANAELDLQRTRLVAPFDVRITEVKINPAQYANKGQLLFSADGIERAEIEVQFPIGKLRPLIAGGQQNNEDAAATPATEKIPGAMDLEATVRLKTATHTVTWEARVDRVAGIIDSQTQTIGVVVAVDNPYLQAQPGQRPPLIRNTAVEVELRKRPKGKPVVVPTAALHAGKIYVMNAEKRLEVRSVKPFYNQDGATAIIKGLEEGETVVVSDLIPAIPGMLLDPVEDEKTLMRLKAAATGQQGRQE